MHIQTLKGYFGETIAGAVVENLRAWILPLERRSVTNRKINSSLSLKRRAGFVLESRNLWPVTAVHGCSGHKMATNDYWSFYVRQIDGDWER